jgi:hypothetical protein
MLRRSGRQTAGDAEAVGDDRHFGGASQNRGQDGGRRPRVDHDRIAFAQGACRRFGNGALRRGVADQAIPKGGFGAGLRRDGPAMYAPEQSSRFEMGEVAANRLARHAEMAGDLFDAELPALPGQSDDIFAPEFSDHSSCLSADRGRPEQIMILGRSNSLAPTSWESG